MDESWIAPLHNWGLRCASKFTIHDPALDEEDLVQQAWLSAYARIAAIPDTAGRRKFLAVAIRNHAFHAIRRRKVRPERSLNEPITTVVNGGLQRDFTLEGALPSPGDLVDRAIASVELAELVAEAEAGNAYVATALLEATVGFRDAALLLGIDTHTVRTRLHRWRSKVHGQGSRMLLTAAEAADIRARLAAGDRRSHIANRYGVAAATIDRVRLGRTHGRVAS